MEKKITHPWVYGEPNFLYEKYLRRQDSAWIGHVYFAYDLIFNTSPGLIVELGTHRGHSFFSFAQAVKDKGIDTKMYAIDSWEGDKQAGFYGDEIYNNVGKIAKEFYPAQKINFMRGHFNTFVKDFENNSIDILHIDGLHTYAAVKTDLNDWLPKVKKDGIILLHDISEKSEGFGVYKLWDEIKLEYKTREMTHSHGLGVIFMSEDKYNQFKDNLEFWNAYYPKCHELSIFEEQFRESQAIIDNLDKSEQNKMEIIQSQEKELLEVKSSKVWRLRESMRKYIGK